MIATVSDKILLLSEFVIGMLFITTIGFLSIKEWINEVEDIIAISSSAGTVKAGLNCFKSLFERCPLIKQELDVTDSDMDNISSTIEIMGKIYTNVRNKI